MLIAVVDLTRGHVRRATLERSIRAINRQLERDFGPAWELSAALALAPPGTKRRDTDRLAELGAEAVLYVQATARPGEYDGFHDVSSVGIPFGVVYLDLAARLREPVSVTMSHEALELVADPQSNLFAAGPHPNPRVKKKTVLFWYEVCDAVQDEKYEISPGVEVSNFVLPLYFTLGEQPGQNDFLGKRPGYDLKSFGVNPGGYVGYTSPLSWVGNTYEPDERAKERAKIKKAAKYARRATRYRHVKERVQAAGQIPGT